MKYMIASDLHGSAFYCNQLMQAMEREQPDKLVLLGDLLYHGPRNDLPKGYAPKDVIAMLNEKKERLFCVRGNCDTEVDQMVLEFPILSDSALLMIDGKEILAVHGHRPLPPVGKTVICWRGHSHVPFCGEQDGVFCLNPGSVSIPKEQSPRGYLVLEAGQYRWCTLDGTVYHTWDEAERAMPTQRMMQFPSCEEKE